jgi:ABC-type uncharacterized transport system permease subunit
MCVLSQEQLRDAARAVGSQMFQQATLGVPALIMMLALKASTDSIILVALTSSAAAFFAVGLILWGCSKPR